MKSLKKLLGRRAPESETDLLAPVRMQALGTLVAFLEHRLGARVTISQASVFVTDLVDDPESSPHRQCKAFVEAYFFWEGMAKRHGRTYEAPLPPRIMMTINFGSDDGQVAVWKPIDGGVVNLDNVEEIKPSLNFMLNFMRIQKVAEFTAQFNLHRPFGFSVMPSGHDKVIWNINPKPGEVRHLG